MASDNFPYSVLKVVDLKLQFIYNGVDDGVVYLALVRLRLGGDHYNRRKRKKESYNDITVSNHDLRLLLAACAPTSTYVWLSTSYMRLVLPHFYVCGLAPAKSASGTTISTSSVWLTSVPHIAG